MTKNKQSFTTEIFDNKEDAERAYSEAIAQGYKPEEINVLMSEDSRKEYYDSYIIKKEGDKSMEGFALGGAVGGAVVGTLGAIIGITTSVVIPGLGLVIGGPLAVGLAGAGAGSISGGIIGALIGWGIPEDRAHLYEKGIQNGGIVLGVKEEDSGRAAKLREEWQQHHR